VSPKAKELKTIYLKLYCEDRSSHWSSSKDSTVVTAVAWVHSLAWELPHAVGAAVKRKNNLEAMTQYLGLVNPNQILFFPFFKNDFIVMNVFVCSFVFLGPHHGTWSIQSCSCWPMPQPQECQIRDVSVTYSAACDNTRSLTH